MDAHDGSKGAGAERDRARAAPTGGESVLDLIAHASGASAKITLRDSEHGETPILDPKSRAADVVPRGRASYQILGEIARGGMGVILKAHDHDLGRDVALKVLDDRLARNPSVVQRFVEEAQVGGQLQHPGVVPVYDLGVMADQRPFFTMKLVKGRTLQAMLSRRKTLDEDRRRYLAIFESVCQTVAYAHSKGVIHRDLKPANVMVGAFGEVQVVDWGLSKVLRHGGVADEIAARQSDITRRDITRIETVRSGPGTPGTDSVVGSVLGTPGYMPPEQARGDIEALDERADVFALGAVLCEILSGHPPYVDGPNARAIEQAARADLAGARARLASSGADPELVELCSRCLAAAPAARPANAAEVADSIHAHLSATEERARKAQIAAAESAARATQERRARRLTLTLAGTIVVALVAAGLAWMRFERDSRERFESLRNQVEEGREHAYALQASGLDSQALEAIARTRTLVAGRPEGDPLRELVDRAAVAVEEHASKTRQAAEQAARDDRLLARLDQLSVAQAKALTGQSKNELDEVDRAFSQAFSEWGVDIESDIRASLARLRTIGRGVDLALDLDDWARLRRLRYGADTDRADGLTSLAADLDPDPRRLRLREALLARDTPTLLALADGRATEELPPSTLWMLAKALLDLRESDAGRRLLDRASSAYPDNYRLRVSTAIAWVERERPDLALEHIVAARALRPDDVSMDIALTSTLSDCGRLDAAVRAIRSALAHHRDATPDQRASLLQGLAVNAFMLQDMSTARSAVREMIALGLNGEETWFGSVVYDYYDGVRSRAELDAIVSDPRSNTLSRFLCALALAFPPEGFPSDPSQAVKILEPDEAAGPQFTQMALAFAHAALRHSDEALRRCDRCEASGWPSPEISGSLATIRARAHASKGDLDAAKKWLDLARDDYRLITAEDPGAWSRSMFAHALRIAEAEVERR